MRERADLGGGLEKDIVRFRVATGGDDIGVWMRPGIEDGECWTPGTVMGKEET